MGWRTPRAVQYQPKEIKKKHYRFTMNRPWTDEFSRQNRVTRKKVYVKPIAKWSFFRGDMVRKEAGTSLSLVPVTVYASHARHTGVLATVLLAMYSYSVLRLFLV